MEFENLMDIPLNCECNLGETYITIAKLLRLETGSVIKLNTVVGGNATLAVSGTKLLTGEVGSDSKKFSFKVADVILEK